MEMQAIVKPIEANQSIPYVITPRHTFLDTRRPIIRWHKVLGATSYTVKLLKDAEIVWTTETTETQFRSSEDLPLEAGITYSIVVDSNNGYSSEMDTDVDFKLLDEQKILEFNNAITKEKAENLANNETLKLVKLTDLYREHGLYAKAIKLLKQKISHSVQPAIIYLELGDFYFFIGLYLSAQKQYRKAIKLTQNEPGLKVSINAKKNLMAIHELLGNQNEIKELEAEVQLLDIQNKEAQDDSLLYSSRYVRCCIKNGNSKKYDITIHLCTSALC